MLSPKKLAERVAQLKVGDGFTEGVTQGPLIDAAALAKVESHVADALSKGARLVAGGKRHTLGGTFYEPTVLADVSPDALAFREETFGPVAPLFRFKTDDEVIELANRTEFGFGLVLLQPGYRAHLAGRRSARLRHGRREFRSHFQ